MKKRLVMVLMLAAIASATFGQDSADEKVVTMRRDIFEDTILDGIKHYRAENFDKAFDLLGRTAVQGDKESQYLIGLMYLKGQGVDKHQLRGLAWMKTACESEMKKWVRDYKKITKKLNQQQLARVDKQAEQYVRLYGMQAQNVTCKNESIVGSYRKQYVCRKESGWVMKGQWDLPSMREFEQYNITGR